MNIEGRAPANPGEELDAVLGHESDLHTVDLVTLTHDAADRQIPLRPEERTT